VIALFMLKARKKHEVTMPKSCFGLEGQEEHSVMSCLPLYSCY